MQSDIIRLHCLKILIYDERTRNVRVWCVKMYKWQHLKGKLVIFIITNINVDSDVYNCMNLIYKHKGGCAHIIYFAVLRFL